MRFEPPFDNLAPEHDRELSVAMNANLPPRELVALALGIGYLTAMAHVADKGPIPDSPPPDDAAPPQGDAPQGQGDDGGQPAGAEPALVQAEAGQVMQETHDQVAPGQGELEFPVLTEELLPKPAEG